jgi:hypothetical protein
VKYLLLLFPLTCNAGFYAEIGLGKNGLFQDWEGSDSVACMLGFGYTRGINQNIEIDLSYRHHSQCTRGEGFDDREEDTLDSVGVYLRYNF